MATASKKKTAPVNQKITHEVKTVTLKNGKKKKETVSRVNGRKVYTAGDRGAPPVLAKPKIDGAVLRSLVLRVDADFATAIRAEAKAEEMNITAVTRRIYAEMYGKK